MNLKNIMCALSIVETEIRRERVNFWVGVEEAEEKDKEHFSQSEWDKRMNVWVKMETVEENLWVRIEKAKKMSWWASIEEVKEN